MSSLPRFDRSVLCRFFLAVCLAVAVVTGAAAEDLKKTTSLGLVPEDASFYASCLRNGEKLAALTNSNAYRKLEEQQFFQMAMAAINQQLNDPSGPLADPSNKEALDVVGDMFANEVFVFGDAKYVDVLQLVQRIQLESNLAAVRGAIGQGGPVGRPDVGSLLKIVLEHKEGLDIPSTLFGFRLSDAERGKRQFARLTVILDLVLMSDPVMAERYKKISVGDDQFITLTLDGTMIPWGEIEDEANVDEFREQYDELKALIEKKTLTISLGIRDDVLLLAFGPDASVVTGLGGGKVLHDRDELAPLRKHAEERISGISYVSKRLAGLQASGAQQQIDSLFNMASLVLPQVPTDEATRKELQDDLATAKQSLAGLLPEAGASVSFEFMTDTGFEGYKHHYAVSELTDGSKPLSLLEHVGGDPIGFSIGRTKSRPETFDALATVIERGIYYGEKIGLPQASEADRAMYDKMSKVIKPLLGELRDVTREQLVPAFADGQSAIVFDAEITSTQWFAGMPPMPNPLPMFEIGCVMGVSDAAKVKSAMASYHDIAQRAVDGLHEVDPDSVPKITLPAPTPESAGPGELVKLTLPLEWGVDEQIAPNAGLSDKVAVLSLAPATTERLMTPTPFALRTGPLADRSRPLAGAGYYNSAKLVGTLDAWLKTGLQMFGPLMAGGLAGPGGNPADALQSIMSQYDATIAVLQCYKGYSSATYIEDGATVTHHVSVYEDLAE